MATSGENLIDEENYWKSVCEYIQKDYSENLNALDVCPISVLKERLAISLFGCPENFPLDCETIKIDHYNTKQKKYVERIEKLVLKHKKNSSKDIVYINFVLVLGRTKSKNAEHFQLWICKIPGIDGEKHSFIDYCGRLYKNWQDFKDNNTFFEATICCPKDGIYKCVGETLEVEFLDTPACRMGQKVLKGLDVTSCVTSVGAGCVITAALFTPIGLPIAMTAVGVTVAGGLYGGGRSIQTLADRGKHNQTLSFLNSEARAAWLGVFAPIFGIASGGATAFAVTASRMGLSMSQAVRLAINITNGLNCTIHGVCLSHDIYKIIESKMNDEVITAAQIFQCVASALLFANAVISTHQARMLLQSLPPEDGFFTRLSKPTQMENGVFIRPINILTGHNISPMISLAIPWAGLLLKIPPNVCTLLEDIYSFLIKNRERPVSEIIVGILPQLKSLWNEIQHFASTKKGYKNIWENASYSQFLRNKHSEYFDKNSSSHKKSGHKKNSQNKSSTQTTQTHPENNNMEDDISIIDFKWNGQKETIDKVILQVMEENNLSQIDILQISHFVFERLKKDVREKEKEFQAALKRSKMSEEDLEKLFGIIKDPEHGRIRDREQYFAAEVMKSYHGLKLIEMKQQYDRLMKNDVTQIPLLNLPGSKEKLMIYSCNNEGGSRKQQFLNILKYANVPLSPHDKIYSSKYYCFVELQSPMSDYTRAGVINFAEDEKLRGIIYLQERG